MPPTPSQSERRGKGGGTVKVKVSEMVAGVKAHALRHYEEGGWDVVVECMEDSDILREVEGCKTVAGAIRKVGAVVGVYDDYRKEIQATAW